MGWGLTIICRRPAIPIFATTGPEARASASLIPGEVWSARAICARTTGVGVACATDTITGIAMGGCIAAYKVSAKARQVSISSPIYMDLQYPDVEQHFPQLESPHSQSWLAGPHVPS